MSNQEIYKGFRDYCESIASEILESTKAGYNDPDDYDSIASEYADGSQYAIYYSDAWDLVNAVRGMDSLQLYDAESYAEDFIGDSPMSLDHIMTLIAYALVYFGIIEALEEMQQ